MIISLLFSIFLSYILYKCFESGGFKRGFIFCFIFNLIKALIQNGTDHIFLVLLLTILITLATTFVDYLIFLKTTSFISYLILSIILGLVITFILTIIISSILIF